MKRQTYKLIFIALLLLGLCVNGVQAYFPVYPVGQNGTYVASTTIFSTSYEPYFATNPALSLVGTHTDNSWFSATPGFHQRFHIDIGSAALVSFVEYQNYHNAGSNTERGVKNFTMWGSNDESNFLNLTYTNDTGWTQLQTSSLQMVQHVSADVSDPQNFTVNSSSVAYRYYAFKFNGTWGADDYMGLRRVVLETSPPTVTFSATPTTGVNPLTVSFNDTTTSGSPITSYNASLGDGSWWNGTTFPATNITHGYSTAGNYTVNWYVSNAEGTGSASTTITVWGAVHSAFSMFNAAGTAPHTTYLYDQSTNLTPGPATYAWDLGDGNTSTSANLFFTWNKTGEYNVTHTVSNGLSSSTSFTNVTVGTPTPPVAAPVASFYGSPTTGNVPLTVSFTDVSSNTPTSWNWSFGDGLYSELQDPQHRYNSSGFKNVALTATNSAGSNVTTRLKFVKVS